MKLQNSEVQHEAYFSTKEHSVESMKVILANALGVDAEKFEVRKARKDRALGPALDAMQSGNIKLILNETVDKTRRRLDVYHQIEGGRDSKENTFKIPTELRPQQNDQETSSTVNGAMKNAMNALQRPIEWMTAKTEYVDGDVAMNGHCKMEEVPDDDGLDVYCANSAILYSLNVLKESDGAMIKRAMMKEVVARQRVMDGVDPMCCRLSFRTPLWGQLRWQIIRDRWNMNTKKRDGASWNGLILRTMKISMRMQPIKGRNSFLSINWCRH